MRIGPRYLKLRTCQGCPALTLMPWIERTAGVPSDQGLKASCGIANNRLITAHWLRYGAAPKWCPAEKGK